MTERIKFEVDDAELEAVIARLDEAILKKAQLFDVEIPQRLGEEVIAAADMVEAEIEATVERLTAELLTTEEIAAVVEASVDATVARLTAEILAVQTLVTQTETSLYDAFMGMGLPTVDRATRMILLRIPGLREALRLLYVISMMRRTLRLEDMRGPITAAITAAIYAAMALQYLERRQSQLEAEMAELKRITTQRLVTMEEALRGYDRRPEIYRSTIAP